MKTYNQNPTLKIEVIDSCDYNGKKIIVKVDDWVAGMFSYGPFKVLGRKCEDDEKLKFTAYREAINFINEIKNEFFYKKTVKTINLIKP